ncbi:hypothetical protein BDZ97DRAFT_1677747 [Flammula alnicola]|nr:hypothetical protein BDZ97DRAFT_1677747 [Flammula alnicola]
MEALQMLKFSLKKGRQLNFTEGTGRQAELEYMEKLMTEQTRIPTDMTAYLSSLLSGEGTTDDAVL